MQIKRISAISLRAGDFDDIACKEREAVRWLEAAAERGSDLAVFPEAFNVYRGDGPDNPRRITPAEAAFDDPAPLRRLRGRAVELGMALSLCVYLREAGKILNAMLLYGACGRLLGRYIKRNPTLGELEEGVAIGEDDQPLIDWDGIKVGCAICFDVQFEEVFADQAGKGARLMLIPSLCPGGTLLDAYALKYSLPMALAYGAWSRILDYAGRELAAHGYRSEAVGFGYFEPLATADVNFDFGVYHLDDNHRLVKPILKKYGDCLEYLPDTANSVFSMASLRPEVTVAAVEAEFGLEPLRDFLPRFRRRKLDFAK